MIIFQHEHEYDIIQFAIVHKKIWELRLNKYCLSEQ